MQLIMFEMDKHKSCFFSLATYSSICTNQLRPASNHHGVDELIRTVYRNRITQKNRQINKSFSKFPRFVSIDFVSLYQAQNLCELRKSSYRNCSATHQCRTNQNRAKISGSLPQFRKLLKFSAICPSRKLNSKLLLLRKFH